MKYLTKLLSNDEAHHLAQKSACSPKASTHVVVNTTTINKKKPAKVKIVRRVEEVADGIEVKRTIFIPLVSKHARMMAKLNKKHRR